MRLASFFSMRRRGIVKQPPSQLGESPQKQATPSDSGAKGTGLAALTALGIVYGDLGTSPLYTMQTIIGVVGPQSAPATSLGVLSLLFWTLLITISVKYCVFVMRADNHGEGGILALMSLVGMNYWRRGTYVGATLGLLGAALIYGDGLITPAISVLSALEGVNVVTPALKPYILPAAVLIIVALFAAQRFGTATIGKAFGPIMLLWFAVIGVLGLISVVHHPVVLTALNPLLGLHLLINSGATVLPLLGGVFLCATGGEALYADMGHIGKTPIRLAWYVIVLPGLLLSYAGQTGLLLDRGSQHPNLFFDLAPHWAIIPLVLLATFATIIASQAIITGSFSMTRQAMQLGWMPGFNIRQTSDKIYGQIYVPVVNVLMAIGTILIAISFGSSDRLAGAFGTAVSTTMVLTTLLLIRAMLRVWRWSPWIVVPAAALFLIVDVAFFSANLAKIAAGGWIPLVLGGCIYAVMVTWRTGAQAVRTKISGRAEPAELFVARLKRNNTTRVPGVAVFLTRTDDQIPAAIGDFVRNMGSLHETVIALRVTFEEQPRIEPEQRSSVESVADGFWRVVVRYGFIEVPDLVGTLEALKGLPKAVDLSKAVFIGTQDSVSAGQHGLLTRLRLSLFAFLFRNAVHMSDRFSLPPGRTIEVSRKLVL